MNKTTLRKTINWCLIPLFLLTLWTGIELHVTDHLLDHDKWHNFAVLHSIFGIMMMVALILHIQQHWAFYKSLGKPLKAKKARVRRLAVVALTILFLFLVISGLWMLIFDAEEWTHLGLLHFWIGIIASLFAIKHILKRRKSFEVEIINRPGFS